MTSVALRGARPEDHELAVSMLRLSMGGAADSFADVESGWTSQKLLAALFARKSGRFSYQFGTVIAVDDADRGMLFSYPGARMMKLDLDTAANLLFILGLRSMFRLTKRILPMLSVREGFSGEYYISNVGVLPEFQGKGLGARLLLFAEDRARQLALRKCSLIVDQHNEGAIRLYQRSGYQIVFSATLKGRGGEVDSGYHRMVKALA